MAAVINSAPLLERDEQLAALRRAWHLARQGRGSAWFVVAEAGGGKTRLASEFARDFGSRALWGTAEPVSPPEPFLAVSSALPAFRPGASRAQSIAGAVTAIEAAAGDGPILLVLDDLHFADEGTIAVVVRLSAVCASRPWLVLAAYRPGEGPPGLLAPLTEALAQRQAQRLELPPLSREAVGVLAASVGGRSLPPAELESVVAGSGGNPWFAEALARGNGALAVARDRIEVRLDRLETARTGARRVLAALAPAARPLPHDVVAAVCGGDHRGLRRTLASLRDAAVLIEVGGAWAFRHELLRRALLDAMIAADRRDAHRRLAEALVDGPGVGDRGSAGGEPTSLPTSAAEIAMHFAEAGDPRGADWAIRAGQDARRVDAHTEAIAQFRRALTFDLSRDQRRSVLEQTATEAYALGLHEENRLLAEEALTIAGGQPEERARLHQLAARAAHALGDHAADAAHLDAAESLLAGRPVSMQAAQIALARVSRAALAIAPERLAAAAERALLMARELPQRTQAGWVTAQVNRYLAVSRIESGDPEGFALIEAVLETIAAHRLAPLLRANALNGAYAEAVFGLFHGRTDDLRERLFDTLRRHDIGWAALNEPYCVLELVQRGRYQEAEARAEAIAQPVPAAILDAVRVFALVLLAARAGSLDHARTLLAGAQPGENFQERAQIDLARLELAVLTAEPRLGELAQGVYGAANRRQYARVCAVAAVALARSRRGAPPIPAWLADDSPLRAFWHWAKGLDRRDAAVLREVAARLDALECPYEAAMALRDAGDLAECYRRLRALEATTLRGQVAGELRRAQQPIPRRTRTALDRDGLTEAERHVCRLVANADSNEQIAAALGISVRTVTTHLTRIYAKTGARGRTALALWWSDRSNDVA